jgi:HSP20 family molecular chaperone IbpA
MDFKSLVPWRERSQSPATGEDFSDPFMALRREMDRMLDDFFSNSRFGGRSLRPLTGGWQGVTPTVDVAETQKELVVTAELPGLDQKDFEVTLAGDLLTIKGEKKAEQEQKDGDHYYMETRTRRRHSPPRGSHASSQAGLSADCRRRIHAGGNGKYHGHRRSERLAAPGRGWPSDRGDGGNRCTRHRG